VEYRDGQVRRDAYLPLRAKFLNDRYLPLTASSPAAITAYREALEHAANVRLDQYFEKMEAAVEIDPNFFMGYAHRAMAEISFGEYEKAAKYIDQALSICSDDHTRAEQILCRLMAQWKADPKSSPEPLMEELVVVYPKTAEAYELAASCAVWIDKDHQQALNYYQAAQRLRPDYGPGYNMLGYAYLNTEQPAKAKEAFEAYLRLSPDEPNAYDSMGEYYLIMEDYAKSVEYYDQAVAMGLEGAKARADKAREAMAKD
jgi:tetratricopeptide (TPR) repeat protein